MSRTTKIKAEDRAHPPQSTSERAARGGGKLSAHPKQRPRSFTFGSLHHILYVLGELDEIYGFGKLQADEFATGEPLDGLILTLLSQNTNDKNRDMAYEALRSKHPAWSEVAKLRADEIALLIRPAGLGGIKAARMKNILEKIFRDFGGHSLKDLLKWTPVEAKEYLSCLPGIGPKTVACVMAFDLDMPAFPVDTHVARLSRRLGWAGEKDAPERIQNFLERTVPPEYCRSGHLDMIEHGRRICHARKPECGACMVSDVCKLDADKER